MAHSVLIADDSAVVRHTLAKRVREAGLLVMEKDSVTSAVRADPSQLSCALLDLDLPDGTGLDIATALRRGEAALPIAFFSGATSAELLARAKAVGPVFRKPDDLESAIAWVRDRSSV